MSNEKTFHFQTKLLHNNHKFCSETGGVSVPIQHASTFHQHSVEEFGRYDYGRSGNPTREALEETIAELEGGYQGFAYASGMAAITTAFMILSQGDHVVITKDVYGGTFRFVTEVMNRLGIDHTFVDMTNLAEVEASIQGNTKVLYVETPSNPTMRITDIRAISQLAKKYDCLTFVDNTFMTPALQRPIELGADVVLHSATKFIGGHSDVIAGLAVVKDEELAKQFKFLQNAFGSVLGVQDAWIVLRGLKTLHVRMTHSSKATEQLAYWLAKVPEVERVYYSGLPTHEGHELQLKQADGHGAVLSFQLKDKEAVKEFVENVSIPVFAVSLGAVESILSYPATMSHGSMPKEEREKRGISDGLLRLSVGLEHIDDLIADFDQAFIKMRNK